MTDLYDATSTGHLARVMLLVEQGTDKYRNARTRLDGHDRRGVESTMSRRERSFSTTTTDGQYVMACYIAISCVGTGIMIVYYYDLPYY